MKNQRELKAVLWAVLLCGAIYSPAAGERLRIGTSADWDEWQRPGNAIETSRGKAGPRFVRRNIDAVANAADFGGGIRDAGSNRGHARNLIDGDPESFWAPHWDDDPESMYVEIDLGRVVSARRILWGSDGSLAPDGSLRWQVLGELPEHPRNLRDIVHFEEQFSLRPLRYLRMRYPNRQCCITGTTAEFQVFGEGYPAGAIMQSPNKAMGGCGRCQRHSRQRSECRVAAGRPGLNRWPRLVGHAGDAQRRWQRRCPAG